jgi:hypothetical protein
VLSTTSILSDAIAPSLGACVPEGGDAGVQNTIKMLGKKKTSNKEQQEADANKVST